ncbi:MAG: FeoA domain-containing protein [Pirellulales bacterium]
MSQLVTGQAAVVAQILGPDDMVHRLHELGLKGGVAVEMVQPGRACIVRMGGQKLCFRGDDLLRVLVTPGGQA